MPDTSVGPGGPSPRSLGSLVRGWSSPTNRDGLALVFSSGLTALVGLAYWAVAARTFDVETVGQNSTLLSAMMLIGGVAHLNMTHALLRFVPVAGPVSRRLVLGGYLVAAVLSSLVGGLFALGARIWAPEAVEALGQGRLILFFMLAAPVWAIFTVQDYVLTAVRRATVVPLENAVFAFLKIALLAVAAVVAVDGGIAISWVVATAVMVVVVNAWLLLRVLPAHGRDRAGEAMPITLGAVGRFVRGDYAGAIFWQAALTGMTVLVSTRIGGESAAVWNIVWQFGMSLFLVASGMGQSMIAHNATDPGKVEAARRAMVTRSLTLVVPASVVLIVGSPWILSVFGPEYRDSGVGTLILVALAAIPNCVTSATMSAARVRRRTGVQFAVPASIASIVILTSWLLMPMLGILAVGIGWLLGQLVVVTVILIGQAPWLPPLLGARIDALRSAALLRRVGTQAISSTGPENSGHWEVREVLSGGSESVVVGIGPVDGPGALLKASDTARSQDALRHQTEVLAALHADARLGRWAELVPVVLGDGDVGGSYCVMESRLGGEIGLGALRDPHTRRTFLSSGVATIGELHRRTGAVVVASDAELHRFVHGPMEVVRRIVPRQMHDDVQALADALDAGLRGRRISVGWSHGDYNPVNVLTTPDGRISAVIDWCDAERDGLQVLDLVVFHQLSVAMGDEQELGPQLLRWLSSDPPEHHVLLTRTQRMLGSDLVDTRVLLLLGWLQHVSKTATKTTQYASNPVWNRRNVRMVLKQAPPLLRGSRPATGVRAPVAP
ncbi:phosphotransferase, partial [Pseudonocardia sp. KRD291]|uniref:phosphotransferase n=1 Tax=Pseudonocardia sp. KRD291 TaxID=2792007 RepID=UPI001C4A0070